MFTAKNSIGGEFEILINRNPQNKNSKPEKVAAFKNIILDQFLNALNSGYFADVRASDNRYAFSRCAVGSGVTPPVGADTGLESEIFRSTRDGLMSVDSYNLSHAGDTLTMVLNLDYIFQVGEIAGNVSEVGLFSGSLAGNFMHNRALVKDGNGDPTTIAVLPTEQLIVKYKLTVTTPTRLTTNVSVNGIPTNITMSKVSTFLGTTTNINAVESPWELTAANGWKRSSSAVAVDFGVTPALPQMNDTWPSSGDTYTSTNIIKDTSNDGGGCTTKVTIGTGALTNDTDGIGRIYSSQAINGQRRTWALHLDPPVMKGATEMIEFAVRTTWARA